MYRIFIKKTIKKIVNNKFGVCLAVHVLHVINVGNTYFKE